MLRGVQRKEERERELECVREKERERGKEGGRKREIEDVGNYAVQVYE